LNLAQTKRTTLVENKGLNEAIMQKAKKEYYDSISFLRTRGVNVDQQMANKIKEDIINHRIIMEC